MTSKSQLKRECTMQPLEMAERMHELEKKLEIAVNALEKARVLITDGWSVRARDEVIIQALLAIQGKQVMK